MEKLAFGIFSFGAESSWTRACNGSLLKKSMEKMSSITFEEGLIWTLGSGTGCRDSNGGFFDISETATSGC